MSFNKLCIIATSNEYAINNTSKKDLSNKSQQQFPNAKHSNLIHNYKKRSSVTNSPKTYPRNYKQIDKADKMSDESKR